MQHQEEGQGGGRVGGGGEGGDDDDIHTPPIINQERSTLKLVSRPINLKFTNICKGGGLKNVNCSI